MPGDLRREKWQGLEEGEAVKYIIKSWGWDDYLPKAIYLEYFGVFNADFRKAQRFDSETEAKKVLDRLRKFDGFADHSTHVWPLWLERKRR